jgi:hypothetical protein
MSRAEILSTVSTSQCEQILPGSLAVLIEVPAVRADRRERVNGTAAEQGRSLRHHVRRPKRRLRRRVRLAGCLLLAVSPIASACTLGWSSRPARIVACSISDTLDQAGQPDGFTMPPGSRTAGGNGPTVSSSKAMALSIEPAVATPGAEPAVPVNFPGYVLPDDSFEDRAHEGS